jgi:lysine 6-dehydrogenase
MGSPLGGTRGGDIVRAVVLGGGGLTGRCAVRDLATGGRFDAVVAADLDPELAAAAARGAGERASATSLDVRDRAGLVELLRGATVCVNAVQYGFNLAVMDAALEAKVPYLDFGGLFHMTRRQLERDAAFRAAGLLAIPGLGQVPGISNVLAMQATDDLERVESIVIRDGWRDLTVGGPEISFTWSPSTFLDEMVLPAMVFDAGAYREEPPMSGAEEFDFAAPVGTTRVYRTLHSEPATLPESLREKGLRHCEWKEGGPGIEVLRTMALLGLASDRPVEVKGLAVAPRDFTLALLRREKLLGAPPGITVDDWEVCDIEVRGRKGGAPTVRHAIARFPPRPDWHLTATEYAVGVAGAIGAELIAEGRISARGVIPPERCIPPGPFREALSRRGIATAITPPEPALTADWIGQKPSSGA